MITQGTMIISIIAAVFASTGFWAFITAVFNWKHDVQDASSNMLMGLGHDRIIYLAECYIERGWITRDEFENIHDYLYKPYRKLKGNGTAEKLMEDVKKLPISTFEAEAEKAKAKGDN